MRGGSVSADYFKAMGMTMLQGRDFTAQDDWDAPTVVVVNRTLARRFWPGENPVGKRLTFDDGTTRDFGAIVLATAVAAYSCTGLGLVNAALGLRVRETAVIQMDSTAAEEGRRKGVVVSIGRRKRGV